MFQPEEMIDKFVRPYAVRKYAGADMIFLAGSYGRAMRHAKYGPIASSDIDLVVIYSDLARNGYRAASQMFGMEDVGGVLGRGSHIMMIDANIHDYASLLYQDKIVREVSHFAFVNRMLSEGYVLYDRTGVAPVIQQKAEHFLEEGPLPTAQSDWRASLMRLKTFLQDIRASENVDQKRILGLMALTHVCDFVLRLRHYWRNSNNQAYRTLSKLFPEDEKKIVESFSVLLQKGNAALVEFMLQEYLEYGWSLLPSLPGKESVLMYPVEKYVAPKEIRLTENQFLKFMLAHLSDAIETSRARGDLAWMENLSAILMFLKKAVEVKEGGEIADGFSALVALRKKIPLFDATCLLALDKGDYMSLRRMLNEALKHVDGLGFVRMHNFYLEDLARVNALEHQEGYLAEKQISLL